MNIYLILTLILFIINFMCAFSLVFIEKRDTTTIWAWLLILFIFPFFGFILYLSFGQNISKKKIFSKKAVIDKKKIKKILADLNKDLHNEVAEEYMDLIKMNFSANDSIYTKENQVKTYINGEDKFKDLMNDIKNANSFINIEYYIFRFDNLGSKLIESLKEKVECGIEVRLLVDGMGSKSLTKKQIKYIKSCGIKFSVFFPNIAPYINLRLNYRNHRKIVVIDGNIGYVGGFNVGDEYINKGTQFSFWRDTHIKIVGAAALELNKRFALDWEYAAKEDLYEIQLKKIHLSSKGDIGIQIISSGPDNMEEYIRNCYLKIITNAKKNIFIQTPYLVLDHPMIEALKISAFSGVDVRIMVPNKADHFFMAWALSASIDRLIKSGVKFYKYKNGFIHSKTIVSDSSVCSIGTANLDIRSFKLNFEINAIIYDSKVATNYEEIFLKDQTVCKLLTSEEYENRGHKIKILESISRLISPIL
ncbi:cardiolipin synthase [Clostridium botulinum]|uniref:Cardiolipin synthase n=1 Tax=Clostridium botulinum (strain Eklund 17B / Type B) TaxID=935198 RepID=B2TRJ2_CLOBB|nr:cardiolipin synthetase [Clostridium botulinum B str. Eklund 17B (NRP)]MBY6975831.1 cardiolipin synthase [Clostridium botulinum]MBY7000254.1 cardiolipin synthase [Clostridium botulinum]MCR1273013.1 cardiolipin synthase [Clostridium botulinum]NFD71777.1 cardiolipin synthase [Clostridium botulinum]